MRVSGCDGYAPGCSGCAAPPVIQDICGEAVPLVVVVGNNGTGGGRDREEEDA